MNKHDQRPRRKGRGVPRSEVRAPDAFHSGPIGMERPRFGFLSEGQVAQMRARTLELLESHGVIVIHPGAQEALRRAGARPGADADRYRIPIALAEEALAATPREVRLCGKRPGLDLQLPRADAGFVMRTGTGAHGYVAPQDAAYRNTDLAAVREMGAVASGLDQVGFVAHPFVHGVPEVTADLHSFAEMVARTEKHCWIQPYGKENVEYLMRIAAIAAGGEEELRARPIASCITCSFSPLEFKFMDVECIVQAGRVGMPLHACSLPSAGGSSPLSSSGQVLIAAAEIVAMVVMAHLLAPGVPVIATPLMFTLDMKTGSALQSCPESIQAASMGIQLMKRGFGLVAHTYGAGSDTPDVDHQSMAERAMLGQAVCLSGADILGGVGQLECATVFSPVQAVLDDEIGAALRRFIQPPAVGREDLNWDEILRVPAGGHFLNSPQTLEMCRDQFQPGVFQRQNRDDYEAAGRRAAFEVARDRALSLIAAAPEGGVLDAEQRREIAEVVAAGDAHIVEKIARPGAVDVI